MLTETTGMTLPRRVLPGTTYFVTRRCLGRRFLLRPDPELNDVFVYCLARAATKYRIEVHALCVMSNHYHIVLTDSEGVLPLFAAWLNRQVAMCVKRLRRWDEVVWEPNVALSAVELDGTKEVLDKVAYTILNPASAGLVRNPEDWPGALSTVAALRRGKLVAKRPSVWFKDTAPKEATLRWTTPRGFTDQGAYHGALRALITHRLNTLQQRPGGYLGPARVKQTSVRARPSNKKR